MGKIGNAVDCITRYVPPSEVRLAGNGGVQCLLMWHELSSNLRKLFGQFSYSVGIQPNDILLWFPSQDDHAQPIGMKSIDRVEIPLVNAELQNGISSSLEIQGVASAPRWLSFSRSSSDRWLWDDDPNYAIANDEELTGRPLWAGKFLFLTPINVSIIRLPSRSQ